MAGIKEVEQRIHVGIIKTELDAKQDEFDLIVENLLRNAPNTLEGEPLRIRFGNKFPTRKVVSFDFETARVTASYDENLVTFPLYVLKIETPITIDGLKEGSFVSQKHPLDPHEIVTFRSRPYHRSFCIEVEAVTRLGDFGHEVQVAEYTAGGLLPPINPLGIGKLRTIAAVTTLFRGVSPENPVYLSL